MPTLYIWLVIGRHGTLFLLYLSLGPSGSASSHSIRIYCIHFEVKKLLHCLVSHKFLLMFLSVCELLANFYFRASVGPFICCLSLFYCHHYKGSQFSTVSIFLEVFHYFLHAVNISFLGTWFCLHFRT